MPSRTPDARNSKQFSIDQQADLFRFAERDHGLTIPVISRRTGISTSTLRDWRDGAAMPAWAIFALGHDGGVPDELLSMLGEPFKRAVTSDDAVSDGVLDDAAEAAADFAASVRRARHPNGPGGTAIVPQERGEIEEKARAAGAKLRLVLP
jgi:hypothetical protein